MKYKSPQAREGYKARLNGVTAANPPYSNGTMRRLWLSGWTGADRVKRGEADCPMCKGGHMITRACDLDGTLEPVAPAAAFVYPSPGDTVTTEDGPAVVDSLDYERGHEYAPHVILAEELEGLGTCTRRTEASFLIRTGPSSWRERLPRAGTVGGAAPAQVLEVGDVFHGAPLPDSPPLMRWDEELSDLPTGHALIVVGDGDARPEAWLLDVAFSDRAQGEALRPIIMEAAQRIMMQPGTRAGVVLSDRELATVLASLRALQNVQQHEAPAPEIMDIATNGGTLTPLDDGEVDALCERLNS